MKKGVDNIINMVKGTVGKLASIITAPNMTGLPGNLAFFLVLSIFPILTLIGVIASKFSIDVNSLVSVIQTAMPKNISEILINYIQGKGFDSNIAFFMFVGFVLASNGTDAIIVASNNLYGFKNSDFLKRRIKALFLIILLVLLFIFMLAFIAFGTKILALILSYIDNESMKNIIYTLFVILKWPFSIFIIYFNVKLIYTIAPDWNIMSKYTTRGAVFTTLSWLIVVQAYSYWLTHFTRYDIFYGSLSNIVILMLIVYLISYILIIGIAINVRTYEYNKDKKI